MLVDFVSISPPGRARARSKRGFSLLVVTLVIAVSLVTAMGVYQALQSDARLAGEARRREEARELVEGGLSELLNDRRLMGFMPTEPGEAAAFSYSAPSPSAFEGSGSAYTGKVRFVRTTPALESSQSRLQAIVYEVSIAGEQSAGRTSEVEAVVYRLGAADDRPREVYGQ